MFPYTGAYYIINCNDETVIKNFIVQDPYNKEHLASTSYEEISPLADQFD